MTKKVIIFIGNTGRGKSTTGNCLLNQSPEEHHIANGFFATSSGATGCTQHFKIVKSIKHNMTIIDTVGFGDPHITRVKCLDDLRNAVSSVNGKIDLIIYLFKMGRLQDIDVDFFEMAQKEFQNFTQTKSLLLITKCNKGWVKQQNSPHLTQALANCQGNFLEFNLYFDRDDDDAELREFNLKQRERSIYEFVALVNRLLNNESKAFRPSMRQRFITMDDSTFTKRQINRGECKTIIFIGNTGRGKSTTGNCLLNQSFEEHDVFYGPFGTSSGATGCTQHFKIVKSIKHNLTIIDTVGFGDPHITRAKCLDDLRNAVSSVNGKIDLIIYVFKMGRLQDIDVDFFEMAQKEFQHFTQSSSLLLISKCDKGWVERQNNSYLTKVIQNCLGNYLEFNLYFDNDDDDSELREFNLKQREESINGLVACVNRLLSFKYKSLIPGMRRRFVTSTFNKSEIYKCASKTFSHADLNVQDLNKAYAISS